MTSAQTLETRVYGAVAEIALYDRGQLGQGDQLVGDLAFDSLMVMDMIDELAKHYPELRTVSAQDPVFKEDVTLGGLVNYLRQHLEGTDAGGHTQVERTRLSSMEAVRDLVHRRDNLPADTLYFTAHDAPAGRHISIDGEQLLNFSSYNYLDINGSELISQAVDAAVRTYGTSVSASRIIGGEIPLHRELEQEIAEFLGTEASVLQVGGHSTNVNLIGNMLGSEDLVLHDSLAHNSIIQGCKLSDARRRAFRHNDMAHLRHELDRLRASFRHVLIVVEGVYSMDGDLCPLEDLVAVRNEYDCFLMVDEAHSFGTIGARGAGVTDHFGIPGSEVDILMGTLSKTLNSCGGYIAAEQDFVDWLKYTSPGFVFSVGITPSNAAAALESLRQLCVHPQWVGEIRERADQLRAGLSRSGFDIGNSEVSPVVPVITGNTDKASRLSSRLRAEGIHVAPITYPAVPEEQSRLRFFVNRGHTVEDIDHTVEVVRQIQDHDIRANEGREA